MPRKRSNKPTPRPVAELSHAVAGILAEPPDGDRLRFRVMDLAQDLITAADAYTRDPLMQRTIWGWIGKIQRHAGLQD
jgi:hypothetical protein